MIVPKRPSVPTINELLEFSRESMKKVPKLYIPPPPPIDIIDWNLLKL